MWAEWFLTVFCFVTLSINVYTIIVMYIEDRENTSPSYNSNGAWWHMTSNYAYALIIIPFFIQTRPTEYGGLSYNGKQRALRLVWYTATLATSSTLHHAMDYESSSVYRNTSIPVLWRSIDWSMARLSALVGCFAVIGVKEIVDISIPDKRKWWLRYVVRALSSAGAMAVVLNDMHIVSKSPFEEEGIRQTILLTVSLMVCILILIIVTSKFKACTSITKHFLQPPHQLVKSLSLVSSIVASWATRRQGDDPSGFVHSLWHVSTATILASACSLIFSAPPPEHTHLLPGALTHPCGGNL